MVAKKGSRGKDSDGGKARSSITGKYVKPEYAAKHPKTTVIEHDKPKDKR